jgi:hypothetical protein
VLRGSYLSARYDDRASEWLSGVSDNLKGVNSPLAAEMKPLLGHHPVGASTGYMADLRGDWPRLVEEASRVSSFAVELTALGEGELPALLSFLTNEPRLPFRYVSVHGPSKARQMPEADLVSQLAGLPPFVDAIVLHPDQIENPSVYLPLGSRLLIENMDSRKASGKYSDELEQLFEVLPSAGFCFDVAHAWTVDPTMAAGEELLDRLTSRLKHVHLSSMSEGLSHVPLQAEQERVFAPLLSRCRDVPWILEAAPPGY